LVVPVAALLHEDQLACTNPLPSAPSPTDGVRVGPAQVRHLIEDVVVCPGTTVENRRARYYRLTRAGRKQLTAEVSQFQRVFAAITRVIETA
jgi:hypothetical protein